MKPLCTAPHLVTLGLALLWTSACTPFSRPTLPGETDFAIEAVRFAPAEGEGPLALSAGPLLQRLAVRPDIAIIAGQPWNPYRAAEDRRRLAVFWQDHGYFDVQVALPDVTFDEVARTAEVTWRISEGPRYTLRSVSVRGASAAHEAALEALVTQRPGAPVMLTPWRLRRHDLADILRNAGYMRAEVYSRTWVDREARVVDWVYFVDAGPRSVVGEVTVLGAERVPEEAILARVGLKPGDAFDLRLHIKRELDLQDTGAFQVSRIDAKTGTEFQTGTASWESWIPPDTGGVLRPGQVSEAGELIPRALEGPVDLAITVVEAPTWQVGGEVGLNVDPERIDPYVGTRIVWRNALGALHHLTLQGRVGYGLRWRGDIDEPLGLYGNARLTWTRPGLFGRIGDFRAVASFDDRLHPGFNWRTARGALGVRWLMDKGLFFDVEPSVRWDTGIGLGAIDGEVARREGVSTRDVHRAAELRLQLVWDQRDDPAEALRGHLVALRGSVAPIGTSTWASGALDLRLFLPFSSDLGLGFRAAGTWVGDLGLGDEAGVPVGARAFGGGAWGMRGFGTRRLSRYGLACGGAAADGQCRELTLGAASLVEAAAELRWLPFRQQFGAVAFVDIGAAGSGVSPFEDGVEVAGGLGIRARLWHLIVSVDVAYRLTAGNVYDGLGRLLGFIRIGEAF